MPPLPVMALSSSTGLMSMLNDIVFITQRPSELTPPHTLLGFLTPGLMTPRKSYFAPFIYTVIFWPYGASRFFHIRGRPSSVNFPEIMTLVQASETKMSAKRKSSRASAILENLDMSQRD